MSWMCTRLLLAASLVVISTGFMAGCGQELFVAGDRNSTEQIIGKYYDGDSAIQTTEARRRASQSGFGYPSGAAEQ